MGIFHVFSSVRWQWLVWHEGRNKMVETGWCSASSCSCKYC